MATSDRSPLTVAAVAAAIASALFSGFSYIAAKEAMAQQKQSLLVGERVRACAELDRRAREALASISTTGTMLENFGRNKEFYDSRASVLPEIIAFTDASVLAYLGPTKLANAESDLFLAIEFANDELEKKEPSPGAIEVAARKAHLSAQKFREACVDAVKGYRADD